MKQVTVIKTGIANLASVKAGLERAGAEVIVSSDPEQVLSATHAVLPGVGNFSAGMKCLRESGLIPAIRERFNSKLPTLAICLGLQMLFDKSEEDPTEIGLGIIPGKIEKFSDNVRVPQLGWNSVQPEKSDGLVRQGFAYFANSYKLSTAPEGWDCSICNYGTNFIAAVEKGPLLAAQFHPELSGAWGLELLKRWMSCSQ